MTRVSRATILHGTDGSPDTIWIPWLKNQLTKNGLNVFAPLLPQNKTPDSSIYDEYLKNAEWDYNNNILIGHSSGATSVLNLLQSDWFPEVETVILIGLFLNEKLLKDISWYKPGQFDNLFPSEFDINLIQSKANRFIFVHGDDDPYCDIEDARELCSKLNGIFIEVPGGKHLSSNRTELPEILPFIKEVEENA